MNQWVSIIVLALTMAINHGNGQDLVSGPRSNTPLAPVMVYDGQGTRAGQEFDAARAIGSNPGALLFVHSMTRNTYPMIQGLDRLGGRRSLMGFRWFTIFLTPDRTAAEKQVHQRNGLATGGHKFSVAGKFGALQLGKPIMVSLDGLEGPGNYALNRRAVLTLVMVRDGRVHSSHAFTDSGEHDLPFLEQLIDEVTGPVPKGDKALRLLRKTRLPKEVGQLRRLTVRYLAFEGQGMLQSHPMLSIVEEITGPLPKPDMALREIVESRMPDPPPQLRLMALRQAEELFHLRTRLSAARSGHLKYTTMKTAQLRVAMSMKPEKSQRVEGASKTNRPEQKPTATDPQRQGGPPKDATLNSLFRTFIRKTNSRRTTKDIYRQILSRSRKSEDLQEQTLGMFQFLLSFQGTYGNDHARQLAGQFLDAQVERETADCP